MYCIHCGTGLAIPQESPTVNVMTKNLPPFPGAEEPPAELSLIAYILRGREWVQIGTATAHPDGKGHRLQLEIAPADGDVIELRAVDYAYYPGNQRTRRAARGKWYSRPKPRS
jgi:hypothetical protein